jgi:hypothetical protein
MDYMIRRRNADLDSTGYMELGPGRYSGRHWQDGFLFIWEDAFGMAEGIIAKHLDSYDHLGMNELPKAVGMRIIDDWERAAEAIPASTPTEIAQILNLTRSYRASLDNEVAQRAGEIAAMLKELSSECRCFYETSEWICILGV